MKSQGPGWIFINYVQASRTWPCSISKVNKRCSIKANNRQHWFNTRYVDCLNTNARLRLSWTKKQCSCMAAFPLPYPTRHKGMQMFFKEGSISGVFQERQRPQRWSCNLPHQFYIEQGEDASSYLRQRSLNFYHGNRNIICWQPSSLNI